MTLQSRISDQLIALTGAKPKVVVAFSGGVDSTVLAQVLSKQRRRFASLRLIHVDHGLQAASGKWSRQCAGQARAWRVPFVSLRADIRRQRGESPEAAARNARYALLANAMAPGEVLVTAQHRDDQVETLLLQLFRGAGVPGLAAMPAIATFGPGRIARPLLGVARVDLESYAREHRLHWSEDPSNLATNFARNFLRHRVMPVIRENWPGVDAAVARSAAHMAEAATLLSGAAQRDLDAAADGAGLSVATVRALSPAKRRNALRTFIAQAGIEAPPAAKLGEMVGTLLSARVDAQPEVHWSGAVMRRRAGRLELQRRAPEAGADESPQKSWHWRRERELIVNDAGDSLALIADAAGPIDLDLLPPLLEIRTRVGGETLRPGPRARTQSLKKLVQAVKLTVEERRLLPLVFTGGGAQARLVAAGERWVDAAIAANDKSRRRARLKWTRRR
jgi:tRNA(Ile)-lysidine synthase